MSEYDIKTSKKCNKDMAEFRNWLTPEKYFSLGLLEVNVVLTDKRALQIQDCCEGGWDWTLFDENMSIIDGGQADDCESIRDMYFTLADEYGFAHELLHHVDECLEEGMDPPIIFKKKISNWRIWFELFDDDGEKIGAGVMPYEYKHKSSALRRVKKFTAKNNRYIVSQENPF